MFDDSWREESRTSDTFRRLVGRGVVYTEMSEDVIVRVEGKSDASDGEPPAYLDETEEGLGAEQTVILVQADGSDAKSRCILTRMSERRGFGHSCAYRFTNMRQAAPS